MFWDMKKRLGVVAGISVALVLVCVLGSVFQAKAAFGSGLSQPPIGKDCVVQFRRGDALGSGANLPVPPMSASINGADTSVSGKLRNVTEEWIVIESGDQSLMWIPKAAILMVYVRNG